MTENNGPVEVCVRREGDAAESFIINVATTDSSPVQAQGTSLKLLLPLIQVTVTAFSAGSDYTPVATTLTFNPDDETQCFEISVLMDELNEGKEDFIVDITSVPDGVLTSQPDNAIISILDANGETHTTENEKSLHHDFSLSLSLSLSLSFSLSLHHDASNFVISLHIVVTVEFGSPNYTVPENEGTVSVCLTTSIGSDQPLNVIVATAPKTATGKPWHLQETCHHQIIHSHSWS